MTERCKRVYRCEFTMHGIGRYVRCEDGLAAFKDGFWITDEYQYTKGSDARFWIPPSAILYVAIDTVPVAALAKQGGGKK